MSIKKRIREYIDLKGISRYKFYKEMNISNGYLDKPGNPTSDIIANMLLKYEDLDVKWLLTGEEGMPPLNLANIQGNNNIQNAGNMSNSYVGSGNYINISLPENGTQKIINPDGTIKIVSTDPNDTTGLGHELSSTYGTEVKAFQDRIEYLESLVKSYKDQVSSYKGIIEEQKELIQLYKERINK